MAEELVSHNPDLIKSDARFHNAIVRLPCPGMVNGLTSSDLGKPGYLKALEQHAEYVEALKLCGLSVKVLEAESLFPDSTFIEDIALCTPACAVITNPGALTRRGETAGIRQVLQEYYMNIEEIISPGTLEAGDVMMVSDHFYIGVSKRTNSYGADQLIDILNRFGLSGSKVPLNKMLHLKSGVSYLENNNILVTGEFIHRKEFSVFTRIIAGKDEAYAANSLWINGKVLVPEGFPKTRDKIEKAGYQTIVLDVSEFRKLDGGLSCLSLRF
jgi:dimethylargininase